MVHANEVECNYLFSSLHQQIVALHLISMHHAICFISVPTDSCTPPHQHAPCHMLHLSTNRQLHSTSLACTMSYASSLYQQIVALHLISMHHVICFISVPTDSCTPPHQHAPCHMLHLCTNRQLHSTSLACTMPYASSLYQQIVALHLISMHHAICFISVPTDSCTPPHQHAPCHMLHLCTNRQLHSTSLACTMSYASSLYQQIVALHLISMHHAICFISAPTDSCTPPHQHAPCHMLHLCTNRQLHSTSLACTMPYASSLHQQIVALHLISMHHAICFISAPTDSCTPPHQHAPCHMLHLCTNRQLHSTSLACTMSYASSLHQQIVALHLISMHHVICFISAPTDSCTPPHQHAPCHMLHLCTNRQLHSTSLACTMSYASSLYQQIVALHLISMHHVICFISAPTDSCTPPHQHAPCHMLHLCTNRQLHSTSLACTMSYASSLHQQIVALHLISMHHVICFISVPTDSCTPPHQHAPCHMLHLCTNRQLHSTSLACTMSYASSLYQQIVALHLISMHHVICFISVPTDSCTPPHQHAPCHMLHLCTNRQLHSTSLACTMSYASSLHQQIVALHLISMHHAICFISVPTDSCTPPHQHAPCHMLHLCTNRQLHSTSLACTMPYASSLHQQIVALHLISMHHVICFISVPTDSCTPPHQHAPCHMHLCTNRQLHPPHQHASYASLCTNRQLHSTSLACTMSYASSLYQQIVALHLISMHHVICFISAPTDSMHLYQQITSQHAPCHMLHLCYQQIVALHLISMHHVICFISVPTDSCTPPYHLCTNRQLHSTSLHAPCICFISAPTDSCTPPHQHAPCHMLHLCFISTNRQLHSTSLACTMPYASSLHQQIVALHLISMHHAIQHLCTNRQLHSTSLACTIHMLHLCTNRQLHSTSLACTTMLHLCTNRQLHSTSVALHLIQHAPCHMLHLCTNRQLHSTSLACTMPYASSLHQHSCTPPHQHAPCHMLSTNRQLHQHPPHPPHQHSICTNALHLCFISAPTDSCTPPHQHAPCICFISVPTDSCTPPHQHAPCISVPTYASSLHQQIVALHLISMHHAICFISVPTDSCTPPHQHAPCICFMLHLCTNRQLHSTSLACTMPYASSLHQQIVALHLISMHHAICFISVPTDSCTPPHQHAPSYASSLHQQIVALHLISMHHSYASSLYQPTCHMLHCTQIVAPLISMHHAIASLHQQIVALHLISMHHAYHLCTPPHQPYASQIPHLQILHLISMHASSLHYQQIVALHLISMHMLHLCTNRQLHSTSLACTMPYASSLYQQIVALHLISMHHAICFISVPTDSCTPPHQHAPCHMLHLCTNRQLHSTSLACTMPYASSLYQQIVALHLISMHHVICFISAPTDSCTPPHQHAPCHMLHLCTNRQLHSTSLACTMPYASSLYQQIVALHLISMHHVICFISVPTDSCTPPHQHAPCHMLHLCTNRQLHSTSLACTMPYASSLHQQIVALHLISMHHAICFISVPTDSCTPPHQHAPCHMLHLCTNRQLHSTSLACTMPYASSLYQQIVALHLISMHHAICFISAPTDSCTPPHQHAPCHMLHLCTNRQLHSTSLACTMSYASSLHQQIVALHLISMHHVICFISAPTDSCTPPHQHAPCHMLHLCTNRQLHSTSLACTMSYASSLYQQIVALHLISMHHAICFISVPTDSCTPPHQHAPCHMLHLCTNRQLHSTSLACTMPYASSLYQQIVALHLISMHHAICFISVPTDSCTPPHQHAPCHMLHLCTNRQLHSTSLACTMPYASSLHQQIVALHLISMHHAICFISAPTDSCTPPHQHAPCHMLHLCTNRQLHSTSLACTMPYASSLHQQIVALHLISMHHAICFISVPTDSCTPPHQHAPCHMLHLCTNRQLHSTSLACTMPYASSLHQQIVALHLISMHHAICFISAPTDSCTPPHQHAPCHMLHLCTNRQLHSTSLACTMPYASSLHQQIVALHLISMHHAICFISVPTDSCTPPHQHAPCHMLHLCTNRQLHSTSLACTMPYASSLYQQIVALHLISMHHVICFISVPTDSCTPPHQHAPCHMLHLCTNRQLHSTSLACTMPYASSLYQQIVALHLISMHHAICFISVPTDSCTPPHQHAPCHMLHLCTNRQLHSTSLACTMPYASSLYQQIVALHLISMHHAICFISVPTDSCTPPHQHAPCHMLHLCTNRQLHSTSLACTMPYASSLHQQIVALHLISMHHAICFISVPTDSCTPPHQHAPCHMLHLCTNRQLHSTSLACTMPYASSLYQQIVALHLISMHHAICFISAPTDSCTPPHQHAPCHMLHLCTNRQLHSTSLACTMPYASSLYQQIVALHLISMHHAICFISVPTDSCTPPHQHAPCHMLHLCTNRQLHSTSLACTMPYASSLYQQIVALHLISMHHAICFISAPTGGVQLSVGTEMKHMTWCMLMRWSATICWYRDEAYDMVHANEVECNYLLVQR